MNLASRFLTVTALAASVALAGCGNSNAEGLEDLQANSVSMPDSVSDLSKGIYEVGVESPNGPQVCIASVHETSHRANQVILSDCHADARGSELFVRNVDVPSALFNARKGTYQVTAQLSDGPKTCTASVIETSHRANQVILGRCNP